MHIAHSALCVAPKVLSKQWIMVTIKDSSSSEIYKWKVKEDHHLHSHLFIRWTGIVCLQNARQDMIGQHPTAFCRDYSEVNRHSFSLLPFICKFWASIVYTLPSSWDYVGNGFWTLESHLVFSCLRQILRNRSHPPLTALSDSSEVLFFCFFFLNRVGKCIVTIQCVEIYKKKAFNQV